MRALLVEELKPEYGGCVLKEVETPVPGPGEVQVRVKAAAVNFPDLLQTRGEYQHKPPLPFIPGMEIAGEVSALGEGVDQFQIGDAVVGGARIGGFSEYAVTPAAGLRRKPEGLSFSEAAGYATAYLTAYVSLVRRAAVQPGEWVLVHGAAGGVGGGGGPCQAPGLQGHRGLRLGRQAGHRAARVSARRRGQRQRRLP